MHAAYIERLGSAESIRYGRLDAPVPGRHAVLVDVTATAVNPVDTLVRSGAFRTPVPFPFVIGRDLAGTVSAVGSGVRGFAVGDAVWCNSLGHGGRQGAAAEQAVVPVDRLYRLPEAVSPAEMAALAHPGATAQLALFRHGRLRPGETVVVVGAGGSVGGALVRTAADAGARVVAVAAARDAGYCGLAGASEFCDSAAPRLFARLHAACPRGADLFLDTAGVNDLAGSVDLLALRGRIVLIAGPQSRPELPVGPLYTKDCSVIGFAISRATVRELAEAAGALNRMLSAGTLRARGIEALPLSAAAAAHRRVERRGLRGRRLVLRPDLDRPPCAGADEGNQRRTALGGGSANEGPQPP
ncbi:alcohol dehydrogenase catalytic domain-containing protein [Nocardiopsis coralliicola]